MELIEFLKVDKMHMNAVCERAGMFDQYIEARTSAVFEFFGLHPNRPGGAP